MPWLNLSNVSQANVTSRYMSTERVALIFDHTERTLGSRISSETTVADLRLLSQSGMGLVETVLAVARNAAECY
jgi:hypothetical protein